MGLNVDNRLHISAEFPVFRPGRTRSEPGTSVLASIGIHPFAETSAVRRSRWILGRAGGAAAADARPTDDRVESTDHHRGWLAVDQVLDVLLPYLETRPLQFRWGTCELLGQGRTAVGDRTTQVRGVAAESFHRFVHDGVGTFKKISAVKSAEQVARCFLQKIHCVLRFSWTAITLRYYLFRAKDQFSCVPGGRSTLDTFI